jgi:hypothetical protein
VVVRREGRGCSGERRRGGDVMGWREREGREEEGRDIPQDRK